MSIDPKSLNAEERALLDLHASKLYAEQPSNGGDAAGAYADALRLIEARRALFGGGEDKVSSSYEVAGTLTFDTKRTVVFEPAPAASDAAEAVYIAANTLRADQHPTLADALESWARSQAAAQPSTVGMTPELEMALSLANAYVAIHYEDPRTKNGDAVIAAVRAQAASAVSMPRDLPKVRGYFESLANLPQYQNAEGREFLAEIKAELDAQPKAEAVPVEANKGCNRHADCVEAKMKNPSSECCNDDNCEDCFGR